MTLGEQWVQPAILTTLVYRTGAAGGHDVPADRVLANGQCFLARAAVLAEGGGYAPAKASFSDDVTLARHYARGGYRVGFLDGSRLYLVRSYESLAQMWREWGRSIDLRDSTTRTRLVADTILLVLTLGLPIPLLVALAAGVVRGSPNVIDALIAINATFVVIRVLLLGALVGSYERPAFTFWLSPLADPLAVVRVVLSTVRRPRAWRGRSYGAAQRSGPKLALIDDAHRPRDLVVQVDRHRSVLRQVLQQRQHVATEHLTRVRRHRARNVYRAVDQHAVCVRRSRRAS